MYPILYGNTTKSLTALKDDQTVGLGELIEAKEVICTRSANGVYELDFDYPVTGRLYSDLHIGGVVKSKFTSKPTKNERIGVYSINDELQLFDIVKISEPMIGWISVHCEHCSYRLNKRIHKPIKYGPGRSWATYMPEYIMGGTEFSFVAAEQTSRNINLTVVRPTPVRKVLMGSEGSVLDVVGRGDFWFNNNVVAFFEDAGVDNGITLEYGVDILDYTVEASIEDQYDAIVGYYEQDGTVVSSELVYVDGEVSSPRTLLVDFTTEYDSETVPTPAELATRAQTYATANKINEAKITFDVEFINLANTTLGQAALNSDEMQIDLYDYVRVLNRDRGIDLKAKVMKTEYDVLLEKFRSIEVGTRQQSLAKVIKSAIAKV